jgi:hypothetical protein
MEINEIRFELVRKYITESRIIVEIKSFGEVERTFHVYSSRSQMGLWRLAVRQKKIMYKGNSLLPRENPTHPEIYRMRLERIPYPEEIRAYYDYVQQTLIHVELQVFINKNIDLIETIVGDIELPKHTDENPIIDAIDDYNRQITKEPFTTLQKIIECGEIKTRTPRQRTPKQAIAAFSEQLEHMYIKGEEVTISEYHNLFDNLHIDGEIKKMILVDKETLENVFLYYLDVNIRTDEQTPKRPRLENHNMPFLLTVPESSINEFGLYDKYIPAGAFICKLFDYSSGWITNDKQFKQCTKGEYENNMCVGSYTYIGDRYDVFPFARGKTRKRKTYKKKKRKYTK